MTKVFQKKIKIYLFTLMPLFLISTSEVKNDQKLGLKVNEDDSCMITSFNKAVEASYDGTLFSILKLYVENQGPDRDMQFVISKKKKFGEIGPGAYKVAKDKDGLLNYMDGVFGVLDRKKSGESPFFAHFGEITIAEVQQEELNGYMNIHFKNMIGHSIYVKGSFSTQPE